MKKILLTLSVSALVAASPARATIYFRNPGNLQGWNNTNTQANCYLYAVSSPAYNGSGGSIEAEADYQGSGVRYHAEPTTYGSWNTGTTYFGYALYLPSDWDFGGTERNVTEQYGTESNGSVIKPDWYQAWVGGGTANAYEFSAINSSDETSGTMTAGTWHTIVTEVTYGSGGSVTAWFDGNQAWTQSGTINGGGGGNPDGLWAVGLYEADWDGGNEGPQNPRIVYDAAITIASDYNDANPANYFPPLNGTFELQNEASGLVLNNQGSLTNNSAITQWAETSSPNLEWTFVATSNGYYQIKSVKSGLDAVVKGASTSDGAGIIQYSFGSSGDDQWLPIENSDGSYTFYNLHSGLVLEDPGSSKSDTTQMDQWSSNGGSNQKWTLITE
jgi:hypothetical protein